MATGTIALALAATTAAAAAGSAVMQNQANKKVANAQKKNTLVQMKQLSEQAELERLKAQRIAGQLRGRIRASAAESGVGIDPTGSLFNQANQDQIFNTGVINQNLQSLTDRARSGYAVNAAELESRFQSPLFAGIQGGISGYTSGLSIGQGVNK